MSLVVGVLEASEPSAGLLGSRPEVRYLYIDPSVTPSNDVFDVDALLIWNMGSGFLRHQWGDFRRLRWVHTASAGVEHLLFPELVASEVVITNARHVFDQALAEYTIGLMLCLSKDFRSTFAYQDQHQWIQRETEMLSGKVAVMLGVGPIARKTAQLAKALGMTVRAVGRTARGGDPDFGDIADPGALAELLAGADYLVMVLPGTPETAGMVDAAAIGHLKPTARIVNVGRAATLDQEALCIALRERRIAGAALDVVSPEPLPADAPLWDAPNLLLSPHMSGDHIGWRNEVVAIFQENVDRWQRGEPLLNVVDKSRGYVPSEQP